MTFEEWYAKYNREEYDTHPHWILKCAYNFALHEAPQDYVLVPVEPTEKVFKACNMLLAEEDRKVFIDDLYKTMITAAQEEE